MASLSPTPEYGRVPMTSMRAQPFGPSPAQQAGRAARLGHRQALRRRDYASALKFAEAGTQLPGPGIGSFEERQAEDYLGRQAAGAITNEVGTAMGVMDRLRSRGTALEGASGLEGARSLSDARRSPISPSGPVPSPTAVQPPPAPGASQIPENPVSGAKVPMTGDLAARGGTAEPGQATDQWRQDFLADAEKRTAAGLFRKDAVDQINKERIAAGKAPFDRRTAISMLLARSQAKGPVQGPDRPEPELADVALGPAPQRRGVIIDPRMAGPKLPEGITSRNILTRMSTRQ